MGKSIAFLLKQQGGKDWLAGNLPRDLRNLACSVYLEPAN